MLSILLLLLLGLLLAYAIHRLADGWPGGARPNWRRPGGTTGDTVLQWRPLLVALVMAPGLPLLWLAQGWTPRFGLNSLYLAAACLIVVIDVERLRIPNAIVYPMMLIAMTAAVMGLGPRGADSETSSLAAALTGGGVALVLFMLLFLVGARLAARLKTGTGPGLGMGDVKLAALVGLVTGYPRVVEALFAALIAAGAAAALLVGWQIMRRRYRPGQPLPLGPFLVLGALWALLGPG
jgi:prepilin signal peptidase PulO-like enzyme (type II secretory pathway)